MESMENTIEGSKKSGDFEVELRQSIMKSIFLNPSGGIMEFGE